MSSIGLIQQMVENPGMPTRAPSVAVFTVDTADRYVLNAEGLRIDTTSVNNLYINKQQSVINGYFTRVALTELNMPWNIPNVNTRNNTFTVNVNSDGTVVDATVSITEGFYTGTTLAAALQTALNAKMVALGGNFSTEYNFTVSYSTTTGKFTIKNTATAPASTFFIVPTNAGANDDLLNLMGFGGLNVSTYQTTDVAQYISSVASMLYTPYFDIVSNQLTKKQQVQDSGTSYSTGRNLLARIYISENDVVPCDFTAPLGSKPFTIRREFIIPKQIYWDTKEFINVIDLTLIDYKGNIVYEVPDELTAESFGDSFQVGSGNANWQLTLQVSEI